MTRLREKYQSEVREKLKSEFGIPNEMAIPRLVKIVVNMGCKGAVENKSRIDAAARDLATIAGQRPTVRKARKSIAGFKLREGMPIGVQVVSDYLQDKTALAVARQISAVLGEAPHPPGYE